MSLSGQGSQNLSYSSGLTFLLHYPASIYLLHSLTTLSVLLMDLLFFLFTFQFTNLIIKWPVRLYLLVLVTVMDLASHLPPGSMRCRFSDALQGLKKFERCSPPFSLNTKYGHPLSQCFPPKDCSWLDVLQCTVLHVCECSFHSNLWFHRETSELVWVLLYLLI